MIQDMTYEEIVARISHLLEQEKTNGIQVILEELQPYDIAEIYVMLSEEQRPKFLDVLETEQQASLIEEIDRDEQLELVEQINVNDLGEVLDLMDNDDLAHLLDEVTPDVKEQYLSGMTTEESTAVQKLMEYEAETAGRIMTNRYVWIPEQYTVRETVDKIKIFAEIAESINYIYVINNEKQLMGVVSYRDLILAEVDEKIADIMFSRVISVPVEMDQEEVASIIERYDFLAIPVVEENNVLVGIITVDDIIDVVIQEANEDIEKLSATGKSIDFDTKVWVASYRRLPWLVLLLFVGLISGSIISQFEETLQKVVALSFFMPLISGMTGNTGTQSLAVVVRGIVGQEMNKAVVTRLILREFGVGALIGITCSILLFIIAYVWQGSLVLSFVVSSSLVFTLIIGTLAGTIIPLLLSKLKVDPAIASGPLITTLNDILSLLIYFKIATVFLHHLL
ncbi:magnesium transporter [Priestia filamentosa]|uniref:magnesium transporter n=1 Tax=Priestia filamentosa TaxID=1402861 RepID=UPI0039819D28